MLKFLMLSCKEATYLVSKKEESKLTWLENVKLRSHLSICSLCKKFEQQTGFIILNIKHTYENRVLSNEVKEKIKSLLKSD